MRSQKKTSNKKAIKKKENQQESGKTENKISNDHQKSDKKLKSGSIFKQ